jgi:RHS repeat-associated protein
MRDVFPKYIAHVHVTGFYYFGARYYDPSIGRWLMPDPAGQGWSPYAYCGNRPLVYVDPNGEIAWFIPVIIGAVIGGYQGYQIAEAQGAQGWEMFGYIAGGAVIGGASGYLGYSIAGAGGVFSNTMSIGVSSYTRSLGMSMLSGGRADVSISFGVYSYNLYGGEGTWANPFNINDTGLENFSDLLAWAGLIDDLQKFYYNIAVTPEQKAVREKIITEGNLRRGMFDPTQYCPGSPMDEKYKYLEEDTYYLLQKPISKSKIFGWNPYKYDKSIISRFHMDVVDAMAWGGLFQPFHVIEAGLNDLGISPYLRPWLPDVYRYKYLYY